LDLHENVEANTVTATFELPGLTKENVDIHVHDGRLHISGESKISADHEEGGYAVRERRYGKFSRTLKLPYGVKVSKTCFFGMVSVVTYLRHRRARSMQRWTMEF
jgi:HSP20 family molecular chaperone IbpA